MDTRRTSTPLPFLPDGLSRRAVLRLFGSAGLAAGLPAAHRASAAPATPAPTRLQPNRFDLSGEGVTISYATGGYVALPRFTYQDEQREFSFSGRDVYVQVTPLGTLVGVDFPGVPDQGFESLTLLLPPINLPADRREVAFETLAIVALHLTTIGGPDLIDGQLATYRVIALTGNAGWVG
jgi:hypothetical protein